MAAAATDVKPCPAWAQPVPDVGQSRPARSPASSSGAESKTPADRVNQIGQHLMDTCNGTIPVAVQVALEQITEALDAGQQTPPAPDTTDAPGVRVARTAHALRIRQRSRKGHRMGYFTNNPEFDPDDGPYAVQIFDASAFAGNDGREWAKVVLQVVEGEHEGKQFDHFMNLNNPIGLRHRATGARRVRLDVEEVENFGDLAAAMPCLIGTRADVSVTHKNGYRNTNVVRTLTGESDVTTPADQQSFAQAASTNSSDDDGPFRSSGRERERAPVHGAAQHRQRRLVRGRDPHGHERRAGVPTRR